MLRFRSLALGMICAILASPAVQAERLLAHVNSSGVLVSGVGVAAVTHPSSGQYCIRPQTSTGINVNRIFPVATANHSLSPSNHNIVQWRSNGLGCPAGHISILTSSQDSFDSFQFDDVAFVLVVP